MICTCRSDVADALGREGRSLVGPRSGPGYGGTSLLCNEENLSNCYRVLRCALQKPHEIRSLERKSTDRISVRRSADEESLGAVPDLGHPDRGERPSPVTARLAALMEMLGLWKQAASQREEMCLGRCMQCSL